MRKTAFVMFLALCLVFSGCGMQPKSTPETTAAVPETTLPPQTQPPETEPPATTESAVPLETGESVVICGFETETYLSGNLRLVRSQDLSAACGCTCAVQDGTLFLNGEAQPLAFFLEQEDGLYLPLFYAASTLPLEHYQDDKLYFYPPQGGEVPPGITVPILMYHAVSDTINGIKELHVSPSSLDQQLQYLTDNGYDPIFFSDLPHVEDYDKPLILTFDDGYLNNYTELFPLLQKHGVKVTIFMISGNVGGGRSLSAQQIQEMSRSGLVSFQSHTVSHPYLDELTEAQLVDELSRSQMDILHLTGILPNVLCYPTGRTSSLVQEAASRYYDYGLQMSGSDYVTGDPPYTITRCYISRYTDLYAFSCYISQAGSH